MTIDFRSFVAVRRARSAAFGVLLSPLASAQSFELRYEPAEPNPSELVSLPLVGLVPSAGASLTPELAQQLVEAFERGTAGTPDGARFGASVLPAADGVRVAFDALSEPRDDNAAAAGAFEAYSRACLRSLDGLSPELATINLLLQRGRLMNADDRAFAAEGSRQMLANWERDRCGTPLHDFRFDAAQLHAAAEGMLTDDFGSSFAGQGLLDLIATLTPVFYGPTGFWVSDRASRLDALLATGLAEGLPSPDTVRASEGPRPTFLSWVGAVHVLQPTLVPSFATTVTTSCIDSLEQLTAAFDLGDCLARSRLELVELRHSGISVVAARRGAP